MALGVVTAVYFASRPGKPRVREVKQEIAAIDGWFTDLTDATGITFSHTTGQDTLHLLYPEIMGAGVILLDYDNDDDLDIYFSNGNYLRGKPDDPNLTNVLYRNVGKWQFTDVTHEAGVADSGYGQGAEAADFDNDGDPDIFVANDMMINYLFENRGGQFVERGVESGMAVSNDGNVESSMSVDVADVDNDGLFDIMVPCRHREIHTLYHNEWPVFTESPSRYGMDDATLGYRGFSPSFLYNDSDGDMDLLVSPVRVVSLEEAILKGLTRPKHFFERYAQGNLLLENGGRGYFRRVAPAEAGKHFNVRTVARGTAAGDLDKDGDIDLVVNVSEGRPILLRNNAVESGRGGHWLTVKLAGTQSNRDAIGAHVVVTVRGRKQYHYLRGGGSYLSVSDRRIPLGLGTANRVDRIEITWPSRVRQILENARPVDRFLTVCEPIAKK